MRPFFDAVVVGASINGLSAAVALAEAGRRVIVLESADAIGGGARSAPLTLPGFRHDICAGFFPLGVASPFLRRLPLHRFGLRYIHPSVQYAHPLDDGRAGVVYADVARTAEQFADPSDAAAWRRLFGAAAGRFPRIVPDLLAPFHTPRETTALLRLAWNAAPSARRLVQRHFRGDTARALVAGMAAHSALPLTQTGSAAFAMVLLSAAHSVGTPIAVGGAQSIGDALAAYFRSLGGRIETGRRIASWSDLPPARTVFFGLMPSAVIRIAEGRLPATYCAALRRYRQGPGSFKIDWALDGSVPWLSPACRHAAVVHVGGTFEEIARSEQQVSDGTEPEAPFVLFGQQSLHDASRAPAGRHTGWAYCHVPNGATGDMTARIEDQIERFAPGFRDLILARHVMGPIDLERHNANYVGGDISGGSLDLRQLLGRPVLRLRPHATPNPRIWLCSAATPPGPGIHGMCGFHAARASLAAGAV